MTRKNDKQIVPELKALMTQNADMLAPLVQWLLQEILEAEMSDSLGVAKGERSVGPAGLPQRLLPAPADHACGDDGTARAAGPAGALLHAAL